MVHFCLLSTQTGIPVDGKRAFDTERIIIPVTFGISIICSSKKAYYGLYLDSFPNVCFRIDDNDDDAFITVQILMYVFASLYILILYNLDILKSFSLNFPTENK